MSFLDSILAAHCLMVRQKAELAELFGWETRNKYSLETADGQEIGFAAEQGKGVGAFFVRQFLGHWRAFEISVFDTSRELVVRAIHPFRFYFHCLELFSPSGSPIGAIERKFSILSKDFDILNAKGQVIMSVSSPIWQLWTFQFIRREQEVALVQKKWSGSLKEVFTDTDCFRIEFSASDLAAGDRLLILIAALYIDLMYFEKKAGQ